MPQSLGPSVRSYNGSSSSASNGLFISCMIVGSKEDGWVKEGPLVGLTWITQCMLLDPSLCRQPYFDTTQGM